MMQAWWSFCFCCVVFVAVSFVTPAPAPESIEGLTWERPAGSDLAHAPDRRCGPAHDCGRSSGDYGRALLDLPLDSPGRGRATLKPPMNVLEFSGVVFAISAMAGFLGALTGLGGGVVVTPALTALLGVDLRYAMGASLISVIATSSGAAAAYVKEGYTNLRVGMFLEIATTLGAILGARLVPVVPVRALAILFGAVLLYSAWTSYHKPEDEAAAASDPLATRLRLDGHYPGPRGLIAYHVARVKEGFALMFGAGVLSGLLGIGSGAVKVIAMDRAMKIPFKVSTTTSNFMIGVTAAASAGVYLSRGYIAPGLAMPVMLGVLTGSLLGARMLVASRVRALRLVFAIVVGVLALEMIHSGVAGIK